MSSRRSIYILLGSNLNRPLAQLKKAKKYIEQELGKISRSSSIYKTAAWGIANQPVFYNQVINIYSSRPALKILAIIKNIEKLMGRTPGERWGPRIIDIDILFIGYQCLKSKILTIPHKSIASRRFVLAPLHEMIPGFRHPVAGVTVHRLWTDCPDLLSVKRMKN